MSKSVIICVFSKNKKKILLVKRRDVPVWVLPGGGVEKNEKVEKAAIREVKEESGYDIKITKKIAEYTPINKLAKFTYLFEGQKISGNSKLSKETKDVKFFDLKNLPKKIPPPFDDFIKDAKKDLKNILKKKLFQITYFNLFKNFLFHPILVFRFLLAKMGFPINS
jgi:ADP-ribose pyrophosphatase YjhB (NUDIX family)